MTLRSLLQKVPKRAYAVAALATAVVAVPAGLFAWGPDRPTYTIEHPADHITFNSITNNPNFGDERNFVTVREKGTGTWADNKAVEAGKEYEVSIYVHNNAGANLGLVAQNVVANAVVPTNTAKSIDVQGFVNASNATPKEVYDHATFTSSQDFNLAYVGGSAKYYNNVFGKYGQGAGTQLPDSLVTATGAKLGYDKLDGNIPGCFQYAGVVVFTVKPQFATQSKDFTMQKRVKVAGASTWSENVTVAPSSKVTYRLDFENVGQAQLNNVMLKDTLPANVSLVPGTVKIHNANNPNGAIVSGGDNLVTGGINIGAYTGGGSNAVVMFDAIVGKAEALQCGTNVLHNIASATPEGQNPKDDGADVTVPKECQPPKKVEACNIDTKKIETVEESKIDNVHYTLDLAKCKEEPKPELVTACNLDTKKIEQNVDKTKIDNVHYTLDLEKCKEQPKPETVEACNLDTKKIETVEKTKIDDVHYTLDLAKCKEVPTPEEKCTVPGKEHLPANSPECKEEPKTPTPMCTVPGKEHLPADSTDCKETPVVPETPAKPAAPVELPHTGVTEGFMSILGLGSLVGVTSAYIASRKQN